MIPNELPATGPVVQIPRELLRSIPREVQLSRAGKAAAAIAFVLVLAAIGTGVALYVTSVQERAAYRTMMSQGTLAPGKVVGLGPVHDGNRVVSYSFPVNGREYAGSASVQRRVWRSLNVGSSMAVRYLAADPQKNWMAGYEPEGTPLWVAGVAPLSLLFGPALIAFSIRRQRALLAEGRPAIARVTQLKRIQGHHAGGHRLGYGLTPGQRGSYRVSYEFNDLSGAKHTGRANIGVAPPEGSPIVILYNSDEPHRSSPYPLPNVRVAEF